MSLNIDTLSDDALYRVCSLVLRKKLSDTEAAEWLQINGYPLATRAWPRKILAAAFDRGLIGFPLRENLELAARMQQNSGTVCRVSAIGDNDVTAFENVAELAADQVLLLIRQVHAAGMSAKRPRKRVHIGLAAGGTSKAFANHLARKLKKERELPELWLHTLTSGFFVDDPDGAPVVSLGQFNGIEPMPHYVVLHSAPLVARKDARKVRELPFTRDAFKAAPKIDIVVTSVSEAHHPHSLFERAIIQEDPERKESRINTLDQQRWAGDIMWQPYSENGQPIECDVQAVSVVDFPDLVRLSNAAAKYVVCIAGLCAVCKMPKPAAVVPLMRCAKTHRPFNYLVTTQSTARAVCKELEWQAD
jgi:hypothetical protein